MQKKELISIGSSLKICLVTEGEADIHPRLGTTMEWDTGAAHAIVNESGGQLNDQKNNNALKYNTSERLLNNYFIVAN
ncbi:hypothetical protein HOB87_11525 [Candidatus Woesearchaeota archaeon]|nr:hypothetical protein [Candidatus Woesearchaeota archaeon]